MGKKKKVAEAELADAETTNEAPIEAAAGTPAETPIDTEPVATEEAPKKGKGKRKAKAPAGNGTLADISAGYLANMEAEGKSTGTIASYGMELKLAMRELGDETLVSALTPERVQGFYDCKSVTKLRSGRNKSQLSIDKTRRVLRLALVWAAERGIIEKAPLPEAETAK